jgi:regulation of enolase protein 1 (concanavalin A-like superfamily)
MFVRFGSDSRFEWHCEPPEWRLDASSGALHLRTAPETDFWQRTSYGFQADNGHLFAIPIASDFRMSARVRFAPVHQYDQAGLMVRIDPDHWIKTSIEWEPGEMNRLGAVVTRGGYSDWSTQDVPASITSYRLGVERRRDTYLIEATLDDQYWSQIRMAYLPAPADGFVRCGVYACSPKGAGLEATFTDFVIDCNPSGPAGL